MKKKIKSFIHFLSNKGYSNKIIKRYLDFLVQNNELINIDKLCIDQFNIFMRGGSWSDIQIFDILNNKSTLDMGIQILKNKFSAQNSGFNKTLNLIINNAGLNSNGTYKTQFRIDTINYLDENCPKVLSISNKDQFYYRAIFSKDNIGATLTKIQHVKGDGACFYRAYIWGYLSHALYQHFINDDSSILIKFKTFLTKGIKYLEDNKIEYVNDKYCYNYQETYNPIKYTIYNHINNLTDLNILIEYIILKNLYMFRFMLNEILFHFDSNSISFDNILQQLEQITHEKYTNYTQSNYSSYTQYNITLQIFKTLFNFSYKYDISLIVLLKRTIVQYINQNKHNIKILIANSFDIETIKSVIDQTLDVFVFNPTSLPTMFSGEILNTKDEQSPYIDIRPNLLAFNLLYINYLKLENNDFQIKINHNRYLHNSLDKCHINLYLEGIHWDCICNEDIRYNVIDHMNLSNSIQINYQDEIKQSDLQLNDIRHNNIYISNNIDTSNKKITLIGKLSKDTLYDNFGILQYINNTTNNITYEMLTNHYGRNNVKIVKITKPTDGQDNNMQCIDLPFSKHTT